MARKLRPYAGAVAEEKKPSRLNIPVELAMGALLLVILVKK